MQIDGAVFSAATGLLGLAIPLFAWANIAAEHQWRHTQPPHFWGILAYVTAVAAVMATCFGLAYVSLSYAIGKWLPHRPKASSLH